MFAKMTRHPNLYIVHSIQTKETKEKTQTGTKTVLRPTWKIRMSIFGNDIQLKLRRMAKTHRGGSRGRIQRVHTDP